MENTAIPTGMLLRHIGWHPQVRTVLLSGGTQGDEMTGIALLKEWEENPSLVERPGIKVLRQLSNPEAVKRCVHSVSQDLNDFFSMEKLIGPAGSCYEQARAQEIFRNLGSSKGSVDLVVDYHNTTANMGVTLIVSRLNPFITRLVATLQQRYPSFVHILYTPEEQMSSTFLDSLGVSGLTVETGPLEHGPHLDVVQYDKVRKIASDIMDFCAAWNTDSAPKEKAEVPVYRFLREVQYEDFDKDAVMEEDLNPELLGKDFQPIAPGTLLLSRGVGVPEYWAGPGLAYPCFIRERAYRSVSEDEVALYLTSLSTENW